MNTHAAYGVFEQNNIEDVPDSIRNADRTRTVAIDHPDLLRVDRLRLLSDPGCGWWDISYVWGTMRDGEPVWVEMTGETKTGGLASLDLRRSTRYRKAPPINAQIIEFCKAINVYAKGLGLLDPTTLSTLV